MRSDSIRPTVLSRRDALHALAVFTSGAALLPWLGGSLRAEDPSPAQSTSEPTGNPAVDKILTEFQFSPPVVTRLTPALALLSGPGGNVAVLTGPKGALLVDTGVHPAAPGVVWMP